VPAGARRNGRAVVRGRGRGRGSATAAAAGATGRGTHLRNQRPGKRQADDTSADAGRGDGAEESSEGGSSSGADESPAAEVCPYGAWVATDSVMWGFLFCVTLPLTTISHIHPQRFRFQDESKDWVGRLLY